MGRCDWECSGFSGRLFLIIDVVACSVLGEFVIQYRKYIRETGVCVMSEPCGSLPAGLAEDVSACWSSVFPDGLPGWLSGAAGMAESDIAEALAGSLFLRQTLERHPDYVRQSLEARPLP